MEIALIAALGKNRELGLDNQMPWHISEDFKHFKKTTLGHTLLMGRKTYESIGRPLPGRETLILTRDKSYQKEGTKSVHSFEEAIQHSQEKGESVLFVAGGGEIYRQAFEKCLCTKLYLSYVDYEGKADTYFPSFDEEDFREVEAKHFGPTEKSPSWTLKVLERKSS